MDERVTGLDYYQILHDRFDADAWPPYVDGLLSELRTRGTPSALADGILVRERRWDSPLASLRSYLDLDRLEHYCKLVPETYADDLIALHADALEAYLVEHVARKYYTRACRGLTRVIELGGATEARRLAGKLQRSYPRRRALREELRRVGLEVTREQLIQKLRLLNPTLVKYYHANILAILGSYARGDQRAESDLDLL